MKTYTQIKSIQEFNKKVLLGTLLTTGLAMSSTGVFAATATGTMTVTAVLTSACSVSDSAIDFGSIAALNVTADVVANTGTTLQIACTTGTTAPVIYSTTARIMTGAGSLPFFLSQVDGAPTNALPVAPAGEAIAAPWTANGAAQTVVIYGKIPTASFAGQPVGSYSATIVISVDYS